MSVVRTITLKCNGPDCHTRFHGPENTWVDGPVRSEAATYGWLYRQDTGHDYCPTHAEGMR